MTPPTSSSAEGGIAVPMGFDAQLKALAESQHGLLERITGLEHENAKLRAFKESLLDLAARVAALEEQDVHFSVEMLAQQTHANAETLAQQNLLARIEALEQHNANLNARRKEVVGILRNLRTMNYEADKAFGVRTCDVQDDDLEGMLSVHGTTLTTVLNHHQHVLAHLKKVTLAIMYPAPTPRVPQPVAPPQPLVSPPTRMPKRTFPPAYDETGHCHAHRIQYRCRLCGE